MANPTDREQELLELINRMRLAPAAELALLLNSADPNIASALSYFNVDQNILQTQWNQLTPAAPLAWSSQLSDAAVTHNQVMIQYDQQSHHVGVYDSLGNLTTAYEPNLTGRLVAVNYNFTSGGENIFAYAKSVLYAEAGFAIDWGGTAATGGLQNPAGHRNNMMSSNFREVGIAITEETNPSTQVGPLVVTENFGNRSALNGKAWLLGVAFQDLNKDSWYEAGEGLKDVKVMITGINGTTFAATTIDVATTGGYQYLLNPGQYQVNFLRNDLVISTKTVLINTANVKTDLTLKPFTRNDFNADGKADILWRNDSGALNLWSMNGAATITNNLVASLPLSWKIAGTGDFNGDGKSDIVWRNQNNAISLWQMNGSAVELSPIISNDLPSSWSSSETGDFNGDGKSDLLWRNDNGAVAIWTMNGAAVTNNKVISGDLPSSWKNAGTGDFNGDGKSDLLWRNDNGAVSIWQTNGATVTSNNIIASLTSDWKAAGTGDFNGDGKSDILWRNDNGAVSLWQMNGNAVVASPVISSVPTLSNDWQISGIGDYNGDGNADVLWRNSLTGEDKMWFLNGANATIGAVSTLTTDWKSAAPVI
jgi:uncharacterized protein YkwD